MGGELIRCVAIEVQSRRYGYAVLEGSLRLIDWRQRQASYRRLNALKRSFDALAGRYPLDLLVVKRSRDLKVPRARKAIDALVEHALESDIGVRKVSTEDLRRAFSGVEPFTKYEVAAAVSRVFTELSDRLPPPRRLWQNEDERFALFQAVAIGMTALVQEERERFRQ